MKALANVIVALLLVGCEQRQAAGPTTSAKEETSSSAPMTVKAVQSASTREAWFGETHVHTSMSFDAFIYNVRATPDDAYRYAKGESIVHTGGRTIRSARPIDFMAVTDHAEYLGVLPDIADANHPMSKLEFGQELISEDTEVANAAFTKLAMSLINAEPITSLQSESFLKSNWEVIQDAAERHYEPGQFTTFIGYEWTSLPGSVNLHRNVIFRGGKGSVPKLPFSSLISDKPEDLWAFMEETRAQGMGVLAIPHNSNLSDGRMFPAESDSWGVPLDANYARLRNRNEPLVEIAQIKGSSETRPELSPNDEWANFEIVDGKISAPGQMSEPMGSYVRQAYLDGIQMAEESDFNPYQFGVIGASDSHNASTPTDEGNYTGKVGILDDSPQSRRTTIANGFAYRTFGGSTGLAGVWAEENTRESIFDAFVRKEVFGTSGPRIRLRFFGGWGLSKDVLQHPNWVESAYNDGVPMGGNLSGGAAEAPTFVVWAAKDPEEAPLQRVQVIKGWMEDGQALEKVFDVACSDGLKPDKITHRCPPNGADVDLSDCSISANKGDAELFTDWQDPEFDPAQRSFYYVRVLQNPTCRWSTWDAIRTDEQLLDDVAPTLQERAWSSPIWYSKE